uniref:Uncharacterized protein n=1 Tax=Rhizophora mucronata TaxID=61149 RepID=A0A2P2JU28_RHIMU
MECVYIGGNRIAISGMAMQGTNWTSAYGRRSSKNLYNYRVGNQFHLTRKTDHRNFQSSMSGSL